MIRSAAACATEGAAAEAAQAVLAEGGGAVDAIIAGFFGAAGARADVLFAPAVALVVGFGAGSRVFDGRAAQPGRGAARPRGFVSEREIPEAARVAVPRSISMLMLLATRGKLSLGELSRAGVERAEAVGAKARAKVVRRVGAAGVLALRGELLEPLLAVGGPMAGGALSPMDLEEAAPSQADARVVKDGGTVLYTLPSDFEGDVESEPASPRRTPSSEAIVACDGRGTTAVLAYAPFGDDAVTLPELEVSIGGDAVPVRRGVTRLPPGTVLRAPMRFGIATHGAISLAFGLSGRGDAIAREDLAWIEGGAPIETGLEEMRARRGAPVAAGVLTDGKVARIALTKG